MRRVWEATTVVLVSIAGLGTSTHLFGVPQSFPVFLIRSLVVLAAVATAVFGVLTVLR